MKRIQPRQRKGTMIDEDRATAVLFPVASFLRTAGLSSTSAKRSFTKAVAEAQRLRPPRRFERIGHDTGYAEVVARWRRDKRFLDRNGLPKNLSVYGPNGFAELARSVGVGISAKALLNILTRYGNVKRQSDGRYRLVSPLFYIASPQVMAFEPMASFLCDLMFTFNRILQRSKGSTEPELFWRKVESMSLPSRLVRQFISFTNERSLTFLEEVDDWLAAHATDVRRNKPCRRVGLGLFPILSEPEVPSAARSKSAKRNQTV